MLLGKLLLTEIINQMIYLGATCWDQFLFKLGQGTLLARPHRKCLGVLLQARAGAPPASPTALESKRERRVNGGTAARKPARPSLFAFLGAKHVFFELF